MNIITDVKVLTGKENIPGTTQQTPKTILIVEDEQPLSKVLQDRFTDEGFHILTAFNGQEGLEAVKKYKPDLIVLDLLMPVMDGKTMLRKLREIPEFVSLPVVVLTNAGEVDNIRETKTFNNAAAFLIKSNVTLDNIVEVAKLLLR